MFFNVLGLAPGTSGKEILETGPLYLQNRYPHVLQIEKVLEIASETGSFVVKTNKAIYISKEVVVAVGYTDLMKIKGLEKYIIPHKKALAAKNKIQLINSDHLIERGLYVAGILAGHRSQYAIACGSGAAVATWKNAYHAVVHDKLE